MLSFGFVDILIANIGLPMFVALPGPLTVALVPIILIESAIYAILLRQRWRHIFGIVAIANVLSTVIGFVIAVVLMLIVEFSVTGGRMYELNTWQEKLFVAVTQAAWLPPYEGHLKWLFPAACLTLLVPTYLVTVFIEGQLLKEFLSNIPSRQVWRACWLANTTSYGVIAAGLVWMLIYGSVSSALR